MLHAKLVEKVLRDYAQTNDAHRTAKRAGLSASTVYRVLESHGVERVGLALHRKRIRKLPPSDQLIAEYARGDSLSQIAERYGCQFGTVAESLKKAGATMRPRGNHGKKLTVDEARQMAGYYQELRSQQAVAALMGTNQVRVSKGLRMLGIECGRDHQKGARHGSWKGGRTTIGGYEMQRVEHGDTMRSMAGTNGYAMSHRLVMARALGRPLTQHETVHHVNGDKTDNRLPNLQLRLGRHGKGVVMTCAKCGSHDIECKEISSD